MKHFIFDVDGTLTPPREKIHDVMSYTLDRIPQENIITLVTGSDLNKLLEQIPNFEFADYIFTCSGNVCHEKTANGFKEVYRNIWKPSEELISELNEILELSCYPFKYGNHLEIRTGTANFSICGRNATASQRSHYEGWDYIRQERQFFIQSLRKKFPDLEFDIGGQISFDIYPKGKNKSQILEHIKCLNHFSKSAKHNEFIFFGDKFDGNDKPLADIVTKIGTVYHVKDWKETLYRLLDYV